jgi:hypothetical protein
MWQGMRRHAVAGAVAVAGMAALAPAASAAISPSMSVTTATPVAAGSTTNLGLDLKFNPSGGDAPDQVILNLPPGVLANASINNGQCISGAIPTDFSNDTACQLGSGQVTAIAFGNVPVPTGVDFYLTPPPAAGDLAGLAVATTTGDPVGTTNAIVVRPSGDPDGVGVTLDLTLPNNLSGVPVAVSEINSTFTGTRMPATCPATPAAITLTANTYSAPGTSLPASAPLPVAGCAALPYAPKYSLTATRDATDKSVKLATTITQAPTESPNSSVSLAFPLSVVGPAISGLVPLCPGNPATSKCTPVGSVTAQSPDYPLALTGQAYLTGSIAGLSLTLLFPAPFPLTLVGTVDLKNNTATFSGLPDIPLTSLAVTLNGGKAGLFDTNCSTQSGVSTATLTDQNGDKSVKLPTQFALTGCPASTGTGSGSGTGSGTGAGSGSGSGSSPAIAKPHVTTSKVKGLKTGKPSLSFKVIAGKGSSLRSLHVKLPKGLSFRSHKVHKKAVIKGLSVKGGKLKSATVRKGQLAITLKKAAKAVTVTVKPAGLKESRALLAKAKSKSASKRLKSLKLTVVARNAKGKRTTIKVSVKHLGV